MSSDTIETNPSFQQFKETLDSTTSWPSLYLFKFVFKSIYTEQMLEFFDRSKVSLKPSTKGTYVSLTIELSMNSSDEVIEIYNKVSVIPGIICL